MPESLGLRLRQQRERQQIALAAIADQTKIKLSLLEELEHDDVTHWPTGIFRRAFIRAYAHAIGLDQDTIVREFLELYPDPIELVETDPGVAPAVEPVSDRAAPPIRLRYLVGSAIESLARLRRSAFEKPGIETHDSAGGAAAGKLATADAVQSAAAIPETPAPPIAEPVETDLPEMAAAADPLVEPPTPAPAPDLARIAALCTDFGRIGALDQAVPLLQEVADLLEAVGFIVWAWDQEGAALRAVLAHGYSDRVLAQLPRVTRDADNATAAAFRSGGTCVVRGAGHSNGALAIPLIAPAGCVGVLALEVKPGSEDHLSVRALASIVAAQLARFFEQEKAVPAADRRLA
jgi:transcriptional regulator with XRE-family HTH domain